MTAKELDLARAQNTLLELMSEQVHRLERAVAELGEEVHGVSSTPQIAAKGLPFLAALLEDHRNGRLTHVDD
jgi:hypothetical protein